MQDESRPDAQEQTSTEARPEQPDASAQQAEAEATEAAAQAPAGVRCKMTLTLPPQPIKSKASGPGTCALLHHEIWKYYKSTSKEPKY